MEQNKVRSYFFYAIGEIALVMIGILLALQVNNWNEEKRIAQQIEDTLVEIREDLKQDKEELQQIISLLEGDLIAQQNIIETLENKAGFTNQSYRDLGRVMLLRRSVLNMNGYSLLKDLGISHLKDKDFRNVLVDYYEKRVNSVFSEINDDQVEFENTWIEYVRQNFRIWDFGVRAIPIDDKEIASGSYFLTMLRINFNNRKSTLVAHQRALEANATLIKAIEAKLEE